FLSTLATSLVFSALEPPAGGGEGDGGSGLDDPNDAFGWCLRVGAVPAAIAAWWAWTRVREVGGRNPA
ncbi:hypothetical protein HK405_014522, partial [Cladochytrium tenue]